MMIELSAVDLRTPRLGHGVAGDRQHTVHLGGDHYPSPVTATCTSSDMLRIAQAWNDLAAVALEREHGTATVYGPSRFVERAPAAERAGIMLDRNGVALDNHEPV